MALIVANWKMNGRMADIAPYVAALAGHKAVICPPAPLLAAMVAATRGTELAVGAQDCHAAGQGAFTGDTSAALLAEIGCQYVIVGHSERRQAHGETDADVWAKASAAAAAGLMPILCVGEQQGEDAEAVLARQLAGVAGYGGAALVVAYEPIWAIGTGDVPALDIIQKRHDYIKAIVHKTRPSLSIHILYGGSVVAENATAILNVSAVDGLLVGGASLPVEGFRGVLQAVSRKA